MLEETSPQETPASPDSAAAATDAYVKNLKQKTQVVDPDAPASAPASQPSATDDTPERLFAGKYKSPEDLEEAYKNSQREVSKFKEQVTRAERFNALLDYAEQDPQWVMDMIDRRAKAEPEQRALGDDEYLTAGEVRRMMAEERRQVLSEAQRIEAAKAQQRSYEQQLAQLQAKEGLSDEEIENFKQWGANLGKNLPTAEQLYRMYNADAELARARNEGRKEIHEKVDKTSQRPPAIGAVHGTHVPEKSPEEQQADDIVKASGKTDLKSLLGA